MKSELIVQTELKNCSDRKHAGSLILIASCLYFCIPVTAVSSVLPTETCGVDVAGYCCRNDTLSKPPGFELSCFSRYLQEDKIPAKENVWNVTPAHDAHVSFGNKTMISGNRSPAFRVKVESGSILTVQCATAAPNVPSLLTYLKVQRVTRLKYIYCDIPQGNLSFAEILDGNVVSVISLSLEDPLSISDRTLRKEPFDQLSAGLRNLSIVQNVDTKRLDLSDDFFKDFKSLQSLNLTASITKIPPDLKSLPKLTHLHLSKMQISQITADDFSNLTALDTLHISDAPIAELGSKLFADLEMLTMLEIGGLHATEIPDDIFFGLTRLKSLELREWANLTAIGPEAFSNTPTLSYLKLDTLPWLERLPAGLFNKLSQVEKIEILDCGLRNLPAGLWPESGGTPSKLDTIRIVNNNIETLPAYFFRGNAELRDLSLERNRLQKIGESLHGVPSLQKLNLYGNRLRFISEGNFKELRDIEYLNLGKNGIEFIEPGSFEELPELYSLILSDNKLQNFDNLITVLNKEIVSIFLSNNSISSFPDIPFDALYSFDTLDMDDNLVTTLEVPLFESDDTTIHLRRNKIELILFSKFQDVVTLEAGEHVFHIDGNPFKCNDENLDFLRYIRGTMTADIVMFENLDACYCNGTDQLVRTVTHFTDKENCPEPCTCLFPLFNDSTVVSCNNKALDNIPDLPPGVTELNFEGNALKAFPNISAYEFLQIVNLKKNQLPSINEMFSLAPPNLQSLHVEFNLLKRLDVDAMSALKFKVALSDNPWICDCETRYFQNFLARNAPNILDYPAIECGRPVKVNGTNESSLRRIPWDIICATHRSIAGIVIPSFIIAFGLTLLVAILYFKNRSLVTAFTYAHFNALFQLLSIESDPSDAKEYDAFLSYATADREVAMEILNKLESIDAAFPKHLEVPFRLCYHERDFVAGESISSNIQHAVKSSHRTIFVLSESSLDSSWSTFEFDAAYNRTLDDHTSRLIIIIKGDVPKLEDLNENLRAVLATRTYLVWGERWFWKKLFYAMPHGNRTAA